jgi:hypothetical protein
MTTSCSVVVDFEVTISTFRLSPATVAQLPQFFEYYGHAARPEQFAVVFESLAGIHYKGPITIPNSDPYWCSDYRSDEHPVPTIIVQVKSLLGHILFCILKWGFKDQDIRCAKLERLSYMTRLESIVFSLCHTSEVACITIQLPRTSQQDLHNGC